MWYSYLNQCRNLYVVFGILLQHKLCHLCHSLLMRNNVNDQNHLSTSEAKINISTSLDDEIIYRIFKDIDGFRKLYYWLWDIREIILKNKLNESCPTIGTIFVSLMSSISITFVQSVATIWKTKYPIITCFQSAKMDA